MPPILKAERDAALTFLPDTTKPGMFGYTWNTGDCNGDGRLDVVVGDHYAGDDHRVWHSGVTYMYYNGSAFNPTTYDY